MNLTTMAQRFRLHPLGILVKSIPEAAAPYVQRYAYRIKSEIIHDLVQTACVSSPRTGPSGRRFMWARAIKCFAI